MCIYACEETPNSICVCFWQCIEYRSTDHRMSAACQLFIMASRIDSSFIFFLQLVKKCRTHNDESRSKNTPYIKMYYDEWNLNGYVLSIKKKKIYIVVDILSSLLNNYHVHLNINLVRLHLLSICAMLINIDSLFIYVYFAD